MEFMGDAIPTDGQTIIGVLGARKRVEHSSVGEGAASMKGGVLGSGLSRRHWPAFFSGMGMK
jgi:hypothetical protein